MSLLHSSCNALQPRKRFLPRLVKNYMWMGRYSREEKSAISPATYCSQHLLLFALPLCNQDENRKVSGVQVVQNEMVSSVQVDWEPIRASIKNSNQSKSREVLVSLCTEVNNIEIE